MCIDSLPNAAELSRRGVNIRGQPDDLGKLGADVRAQPLARLHRCRRWASRPSCTDSMRVEGCTCASLAPLDLDASR